ncbi:MAG: hypothetical protein D6694_15460 [Gammaproteobacteria bacterium]|nr:MAG: hypothetical protein D6694_15460 [Gammaproteobacteria bacterium]
MKPGAVIQVRRAHYGRVGSLNSTVLMMPHIGMKRLVDYSTFLMLMEKCPDFFGIVRKNRRREVPPHTSGYS